MQTQGVGSLETEESGRMKVGGNLWGFVGPKGCRGESHGSVYLLSLLNKPFSVGVFAWIFLENAPTLETTQMGHSGIWGTYLDTICRRWGIQVSRLRVQCTLLVPLLFPKVESSLVQGSLGRAVER